MKGPKLRTSRTSIRLIVEDDIPTLYSWLTDAENIHLWSNIREFPSYSNYHEFVMFKINSTSLLHFVIEDSDKKLMGTVFVYDQNLIDGFAFFSIYIIPSRRSLFYGVESCALLFDYLASSFPYRKLYLDLYSYNVPSLKLVEKLDFRCEGVFKEHRYFNGEYHDLNRFAFYFGDWAAYRKKFEKLFPVA